MCICNNLTICCHVSLTDKISIAKILQSLRRGFQSECSYILCHVFFLVFSHHAGQRRCIITFVTFMGLSASVYSCVRPNMACFKWCIFTETAFVRLRPSVRLQMILQIAWLRTGIFTLPAFIGFHRSMCIQMPLKIACISWGVITLAALVWPVPFVNLHVWGKVTRSCRCIFAMTAFVWLYPIM